jgi:hypothetical protein
MSSKSSIAVWTFAFLRSLVSSGNTTVCVTLSVVVPAANSDRGCWSLAVAIIELLCGGREELLPRPPVVVFDSSCAFREVVINREVDV